MFLFFGWAGEGGVFVVGGGESVLGINGKLVLGLRIFSEPGGGIAGFGLAVLQ